MMNTHSNVSYVQKWLDEIVCVFNFDQQSKNIDKCHSWKDICSKKHRNKLFKYICSQSKMSNLLRIVCI